MFNAHALTAPDGNSSLTMVALCRYTLILSQYCHGLESHNLDPTMDWALKIVDIVDIAAQSLAAARQDHHSVQQGFDRSHEDNRQVLIAAIYALISFFTLVSTAYDMPRFVELD